MNSIAVQGIQCGIESKILPPFSKEGWGGLKILN
jgi:hypothetical protein